MREDAVFLGIVAAVFVLGGGGYYMCTKKSGASAGEVGVEEDKKMFKAVIKKNTKKVANTETLV